jgi:4-hydroxy-3-polyprenylbenzoate decarboxylase/2,5-furandicarboxylate decarboxylase 2
MTRRIVVAVTGASGAIYGVRLLRELKASPDVESHLIVSSAGQLNASAELGMSRADIEALADHCYSDKDIAATIASGSFRTDAMIIAPCSMRTLAGVATGLSGSLITRAADVTLKERRRLVLLTREAPLNLVHLRNMTTVTEMGGIVFPPVPAFYVGLDSIEAMVEQTVARVLELVGVESALIRRWPGLVPAGGG